MKLEIRFFIGLLLVGLAITPAFPQDAVPQRVRVSQGVASALVADKVDPVYPPLARQARIQGTVVLHVIIGKDGGIATLDLVSGHPMLAPAAIAAVKQWKYRPYLLNGEPVEVDTQILINFTLDGSGGAAPNDAASSTPPSGDSAAQALSAAGGTVTSTPAAPRIAVPQRIRVSQGVASGMAISKVPPRYPEDARRARVQGTVVMHAIISKTGDIAKLELISGDPALAPAAMEAAQQWKYRPYLFYGHPIEVDTEILVNFTLSGK